MRFLSCDDRWAKYKYWGEVKKLVYLNRHSMEASSEHGSQAHSFVFSWVKFSYSSNLNQVYGAKKKQKQKNQMNAFVWGQPLSSIISRQFISWSWELR